VRFAPSPTGYLHVGGARTALFNWLLARKHGGIFVLRVEDTDRERSRDEHTEAILHGLTWLGIDWDEGPCFQSAGVERHRATALRLLEEGKAYRDFSDPDEIRAEAEERGMHPSRVAREKADALGGEESERRAAAGERFAIRFRVPDGETCFTDLVHGEMRFPNTDIDDLVILRSDGTPVYNLAVVSDDIEMAITHVIRGDDHLSNTPKQVLLYRALGVAEPAFGHVPLILGSDGKRLSKRHGATAVGEYEAQGILPEAMFNFLAFLGWNPGDEREVMSREELVEAFTVERILKKSAVFDTEKLHWLNGRHLAETPTETLLELVRGQLGELADGGWRPDAARAGDDAHLSEVVELLKVRSRTVTELAAQARPYLGSIPEYDEAAVAKHWAKEPSVALDRLGKARAALAAGEWTREALEEAIRALAEAEGVGAGKIIHPLRVAVTGQMVSPGIFDVLALVGREEALERIDTAGAMVRGL
ncbi:MAG: glutamate--tRNA ligase, partial [Gemmatimonadota bacterium]|nr:glutamate--tRNA ligase [Gemmatimonadota bacterium]